MILLKGFMSGFSVLSLLAMAPRVASAEVFLDLYGGVANTRNADVTVEESSFFTIPTTLTVTRRVDFDSSVTLGGRIGYWFESVPWLGLALDVSSFQAEGDGVDIALFPVSPLLMLRWPLFTSDELPQGRLQPYVGIGPGIFISNFEVDFRPAITRKVSGWVVDVGLDTRAGLALQLHQNFAIFGEFRFTHVSLEVLDPAAFFGPSRSRTAETSLDTNHFLVGVSFRF